MNSNMFEWSVKNKLAQYKGEKKLIRIDVNLWVETMVENEWEDYRRFMLWREKNQQWFPSQFPLSKDGTIEWYKTQVYGKEDRILFWVGCNGGKIGHIGLNSFNWEEQSCEIDNIIRGNSLEPGAMSKALEWLIGMAKNHLLVKNIYLRTFFDNRKALRFYKKLGFHSIKKIGSRKEVNGDRIDYIEDENGKNRFYIYMEYRK